MEDTPTDHAKTLDFFEAMQVRIENLVSELQPYRENRRAVALAITKLDEARLWLTEAMFKEESATL